MRELEGKTLSLHDANDVITKALLRENHTERQEEKEVGLEMQLCSIHVYRDVMHPSSFLFLSFLSLLPPLPPSLPGGVFSGSDEDQGALALLTRTGEL